MYLQMNGLCSLIDGAIPAIKIATYRRRLNSKNEVSILVFHNLTVFQPLHLFPCTFLSLVCIEVRLMKAGQ